MTIPIVLGVLALVVVLFFAWIRRVVAAQWREFKYVAGELFHGSTLESEESDHVVLSRGHVRVRLDRQGFGEFQKSLAAGAEAAIAAVAALVAAAVDAQLSEQEKEELATELVEHAAVLFPEAVLESRDSERIVVRFAVGARTFTVPIVQLELAGYPREERLEILETIIRARVGASSDPAMKDRDVIRPRFRTPARRQRTDALVQMMVAKHGVSLDDVVRPPEILSSFEGLPYPIDFVLDLGTHVAPVYELRLDQEEVSLNAMRTLSLENLRHTSAHMRLPEQGSFELLQDSDDHGAVRVLLVPDLLDVDDAVLAVAPSHESLLLFREDDPGTEQAVHARFVDLEEGDAPIPEPVRVTSSGFATRGWTHQITTAHDNESGEGGLKQ